MIEACKRGEYDLIITKSVSRFARNVEDFLKSVRTLAEHNPRIGVFFEAENIYSLKEDSKMALSFQATMAEEESRNKSRSMEGKLEKLTKVAAFLWIVLALVLDLKFW